MWKRIVMSDIDFRIMDGCIRYMKVRGFEYHGDDGKEPDAPCMCTREDMHTWSQSYSY